MATTKDNHIRSVVKGVSWRAVGTLDTIIIATLWTGDFSRALKIGGFEVLTKIAFYYLHERAWSKIKWGKKKDAHGKSVTKGISWRVVAAIDTFLLSYFIFRESTDVMAIAAKVTGTELLTKVPLFYLHERLWLRIKWGQIPANQVTESEITTEEALLEKND